MFLPVCALKLFHLVLDAQLQLLQPYFFEFFIFGEVPLLEESFKTLGVLGVFLGQLAEIVIAGQELVANWSSHPANLLAIAAPASLESRVEA